MKTADKIIIVSLIILVLTLIFLLFPQRDEKSAIKIGYQAITANLPLFVALENGYFEDVGLNIELVKFETSNQIVDALLSNRIDIAPLALFPLLSLESQAPNQFKMFAIFEENREDYVDFLVTLKDSEISGFEDLKNKRLGLFPGTSTKTLVKIILKKYMDPENDITLIELPSNLQLTALLSGQIDAIVTLEPVPSIGLDMGITKNVMESPMTTYISGNLALGASVVSENTNLKHPEESKKIAYAFSKAIGYIEENESTARQIMLKYVPLTTNVSKTVHIGKYVMIKDANISALQELSDLYFNMGNLNSRVNISNILLKGELNE